MPRVAGAVWRRVDRLARRAHAFHRFAHHPLCAAYDAEVMRVGRRTRLCRGCSSLYGGAALGVGTGLAVKAPAWVGVALLASAVVWLSCSVTLPRTGARASKLASRGVPGLLLGWGGAQALQQRAVGPLVALALAGAALAVVARVYRSRGPDRRACPTCPELGGAKACSGFAAIVRRERAFMRVSARWMDGGPPVVVPRTRVHLPLAPRSPV